MFSPDYELLAGTAKAEREWDELILSPLRLPISPPGHVENRQLNQ
jgi:hypothetical protein